MTALITLEELRRAEACRGILMQEDLHALIRQDLKHETRRDRGLAKFNRSILGRGPGVWKLLGPMRERNAWGFYTRATAGKPVFTLRCPYGAAGDLLYVKEPYYVYGQWVKDEEKSWGKHRTGWTFVSMATIVFYPNTISSETLGKVKSNREREQLGWFKKTPLFMPQVFARTFLRIQDIQVERLQDITEDGARAEGVDNAESFRGIGADDGMANRYAYRELWEEINGKGSWDANPWVWVVKFRRERI